MGLFININNHIYNKIFIPNINNVFLTSIFLLDTFIYLSNLDMEIYSFYTGIFNNKINTNYIATGMFFFFGFTILQNFLTVMYLGLYGTFILQSLSLLGFWISLCNIIEEILLGGVTFLVVSFKWFTLAPHLIVNFELYFDVISVSFALLTTTIALCVNIYTFTYFRYEPNVDRLILLLNAFVWSMSLLVLSGNMFVLLLGWELIGLTSFFLINFWNTRAGTVKAAFKAFSFNKISDVSLLLAVLLLGVVIGDFNICIILSEINRLNCSMINCWTDCRLLELVSFFLICAASIKSAQIIGHLWLPDSMEAPAPASALIHSATLVSAGIFLILRLYPIFEQSWFFYTIVPVTSSLTACYGGLVAAYQTDVKRLLAYSTISHCGFLMLLTTMGSIEHTLIYLYIHGFFKAISFLCIGNIIRFVKNYQDLRRIGNCWKLLPAECGLLALSLLNLGAAPLFWGFFCKHLILTASIKIQFDTLVWSTTFFASMLGPIYSCKLFYYIFFDSFKSRKSIIFNNNRKQLNSIHYTNTPMGGLISILILQLLAYIIITLLTYSLTMPNSIFIEFVSSILLNQQPNTNSNIFYITFNASLLNWIGLCLWICAIFLRWGFGYNSFITLDFILNTSLFFFFSFFLLNIW